MARPKAGKFPAQVIDLTGYRPPGTKSRVVRFAGTRGAVSRQGAYWVVRCGCGTEYEVRGAALREGGQGRCRACSKKRAAAARKARGGYVNPLKGVPKAEWPRMADRPCAFCGTPFRPPVSKNGSGHHVRHCSHRCSMDNKAGRPKPK